MDLDALISGVRTEIPETEIALRLALAIVFGAVIGLEREIKDHSAGLRTHMLTSLAAAVFTVLTFELCQCLDCRRHHGALFHAFAKYSQDAVTIDRETRAYVERFFCPRCGSSIFASTADEIEVNLRSQNAHDQLMPTYKCWIVAL